MDFFVTRVKELKNGALEIYPDFTIGRSKDLMVRGRAFYAIWDEAIGLWSTDEYDVQRLVDEELYAERDRLYSERQCHVKDLRSFDSNSWNQFKRFVQQVSDSSHPLDMKLTFANTDVKKSDYVSKRLPYSLSPGEIPAWNELIGTLYSVEERAKIEWAIGAVVAGDSAKIQKFLVLYGPAGTGKSTILNIVDTLFAGYTTSFEAKALGGNNNQFATEVFKNNPLVAIQHDGDLSRIEDNTKLNSIISHEEMTMNEKYKPSYTSKVNAFLFMGTNQPVKISDAKSGIIRRLIDVQPTGVKIPANHYHTLMGQVDFELGAIAQHCLNVYRALGKNHYNAYRPTEMMFQTDVFFNFIEAHFDIFKNQDGVSLKQAYVLYKEFCADTGIDRMLPQHKFRTELRNYFDNYKERETIGDIHVRSWYSGFNANKFKQPTKEVNTFSLVIEETESLLDVELADMPAQGATANETPKGKWEKVKTKLSDIDTSELHFVKVPANHIVIDFDLKDQDGIKSLERNLEAASTWPATYAELSKSGAGVHLHYNYTEDVNRLSGVYSEGIEVKVYTGDASLRRRLSKCNSVPISDLASGLPLKEKKMLQTQTIQSEKGLREMITRNLRKEIHPGTKPSVDFIKHILDEAYDDGMTYDVSDMRSKIMAFANNSSNQSLNSLKVVTQMKFQGRDVTKDNDAPGPAKPDDVKVKDARIVLFDVEVYPNLFVLCWKYEGDSNVVRMINPSAQDVEGLFKLKLMGFFNRHYDNHIVYARFLGYNNQELYELSQKLIDNERHAEFGEAYNISYGDIHDFSSIKQSLKKFELDLGILHMELDIPWNEPVPEELWDKVVEYCVNDVEATDAVLQDRRQDFVARQILAELSGLSVNDTTAKHTAKILFGNDRHPQEQFIYTDLSKEFPGYIFEGGKSSYRDEDPSEGGYIYAETGYHENVALLDIASMHPTTIEVLNLFGKEFTKKFSELKEARVAIKRKKYDKARKMLDGKLVPYLVDESQADKLAYALKIVINIVYGLTSAKFSNPFRDHRNVDNIVAKRGALFMIELKNAVQEKGYTVAHIKTDSIKIPDATPDIIQFVTEFGAKYGYDFEHEATYNKLVLVNDAVYVAQKVEGEAKAQYTCVGAQFQHPYVYKTLFTGDSIEFDDLVEAKSVIKGAMYLDPKYERKVGKASNAADYLSDMHFIGRSGRFVPVREGVNGGGRLYRINDEKAYAVAGTKNYIWMEATMARHLEAEGLIDMDYFDGLAEEAKLTIEKFTGFEAFVRNNKVAEPPF
jgi:hypothetical protein